MSASHTTATPTMSQNEKRKTVYGPADLIKRAEQRAQALGYKAFNDYFLHLIQSDLLRGGSHTVVREEGSTEYRVNNGAAH